MCYNNTEWLECKKNYGLRHLGQKTIIITIKETTKSMNGCYRLFAYCLGADHNCITDQPLESFVLRVKDLPTASVTSAPQKPTKMLPTKNKGFQSKRRRPSMKL